MNFEQLFEGILMIRSKKQSINQDDNQVSSSNVRADSCVTAEIPITRRRVYYDEECVNKNGKRPTTHFPCLQHVDGWATRCQTSKKAQKKSKLDPLSGKQWMLYIHVGGMAVDTCAFTTWEVEEEGKKKPNRKFWFGGAGQEGPSSSFWSVSIFFLLNRWLLNPFPQNISLSR